MSCHLTSTHFHLLRVAGGSGGKERTDEAIFLWRARLRLWTAHPDVAQRHWAHASGIERPAWPFQTSGGGGHSYWTWWIIRSAIPKPPSGYFSSVSSHLIME